MFKILKPIYKLTGFKTDDVEWWAISWQTIGFVESMEEAKQRFGGSPVLQWEAA